MTNPFDFSDITPDVFQRPVSPDLSRQIDAIRLSNEFHERRGAVSPERQPSSHPLATVHSVISMIENIKERNPSSAEQLAIRLRQDVRSMAPA